MSGKRRWRTHLASCATVVSAGILVGIATVITYWALLDIFHDPVLSHIGVITNTPIAAGEWATIKIRSTKNRQCLVIRATRIVIDSTDVKHPINNLTVPKNGWGLPVGIHDIEFGFLVPASAATGAATYNATLFYRCNPVMLTRVDLTPIPFTVK